MNFLTRSPYALQIDTPGLPGNASRPSNALSVVRLRTRMERLLVAPLRALADTKTEYETDPELALLDEKKDELGVVLAVMGGGTVIGTIRFIPAGHNLTVTERLWGHASLGTQLVGANSWETSRLIMSPEHRRGDLLPICMKLAFIELLRNVQVLHLHGSTHMRLARLYRRFGFQIHTTKTIEGKECALIHGDVATVARCLKVDLSDAVRFRDALTV